MASKPQDDAVDDDVDFDLDTFELEKPNKPFSIRVAGRRYTLIAPAECDWQDSADAQLAHFNGRSRDAVTYVLQPEDREEFLATRLENFKLNELFSRYNKHFGLPNPGEAPASSSS